VITNQASGTFRELTSNVDGTWYLPELTPGTCQVAAEISANGVDTRNNSFLVDGAWDNDDYLGQNNGTAHAALRRRPTAAGAVQHSLRVLNLTRGRATRPSCGGNRHARPAT
jgi:hypothetical protein